MPLYFSLSVTFLDPECHARADRGEGEWPPSPLRLFQAIAAASAARWNERIRLVYAAPALHWLERQTAPLIVSADGEPSQVRYRLYVPDNVADKVAGSWSRGRAASIADYRTEKDVRPTHLKGSAVHYLYALAEGDAEFPKHTETLFAAARSITHLGWGIDMVAANASVISEDEAAKLPGDRWRPAEDSSAKGYRVPVPGTLDALIQKHQAFLGRLGPDGFTPVPPLSSFRVVGYRRETDPQSPQFIGFEIRKLDDNGFRPFESVRCGMTVAAMIRHVASNDHVSHALGWTPGKTAAFVLGHAESRGQPHAPVAGPRLAYIPLPSIEAHGDGRAPVVGNIRRVLIAVTGGDGSTELQQLARLLSGAELIEERSTDAVAMLSRIPNTDSMIRRYTHAASAWATVTPVILPGYDDPRKYRGRLFPKTAMNGAHVTSQEQQELLGRLDKRIDYLLRKAIRQAGYSDELARNAEIQWRNGGFWPGTALATRYAFPNQLRRFRRLHVRIIWRNGEGEPIRVPGPICLGGGRFYGLGLFAPIS
ncbi:MAG TPA: type I-U CRISPR-associated protein Csb2 [Pirellulales bacterium]|nr:type I-U CRISPR-associated protein Csb2 [Pirellulales bacterium]